MVCGAKFRLWLKKAFLCIGFIISVGGILVGCGEPEAEIRGNSVGNISNGGIAALQGDWIYYSNADDDWSIYRISTDGSGREKIINDPAQFINVVGDWIYYSKDDDWSIYKIGIDGSGREKIINDSAQFINVVGDWIYYINLDDGETIYKTGIDGSGREKINNDASRAINVIGGWIYYFNHDDRHRLYKIGTDGSGREQNDADDTAQVLIYDADGTTHVQIYFEETNLSFSYPSSLAEGISAQIIHGHWLYCPEYKLISFDNYLPSDTARFWANIELTPLEELLLKCDWAEEDINYLKTFIANNVVPHNMGVNSVPHYLPEGNALQQFSAQVDFLESKAISGFRYLTAFFHADAPVTDLTYAYQGITSDQKYYFTARFGVHYSELSRHNEEYFKYRGIDGTDNGDYWEIHDLDSWMKNYDDYVDVTAQMLDEVDAEDFEPSLLLLDDIIKSFQIE